MYSDSFATNETISYLFLKCWLVFADCEPETKKRKHVKLENNFSKEQNRRLQIIPFKGCLLVNSEIPSSALTALIHNILTKTSKQTAPRQGLTRNAVDETAQYNLKLKHRLSLAELLLPVGPMVKCRFLWQGAYRWWPREGGRPSSCTRGLGGELI